VYQKPNRGIQLEQIKTRLEFKSRFLYALRTEFNALEYIEVSTPIIVNAPAPEPYIEAPAIGEKFLRTSPELEMKEMLAAGYTQIYQISSCFREGEKGRLHSPEFTMLEYYHSECDYHELQKELQSILERCVIKTIGTSRITYQNKTIDFSKPWSIITVHDAFQKYTNTTPEEAIENNIFEELLLDSIEPHLGRDVPTILTDYPASQAALSQLKQENPMLCERWELYIAGIEIANAYGELTDYDEQLKRFEIAKQKRNSYSAVEYPEPTHFLNAMKYGIPNTSGCALGIERLIMLLTNATSIGQTIFPN
jgi:lysyl-tRNA synthetase class 2